MCDIYCTVGACRYSTRFGRHSLGRLGEEVQRNASARPLAQLRGKNGVQGFLGAKQAGSRRRPTGAWQRFGFIRFLRSHIPVQHEQERTRQMVYGYRLAPDLCQQISIRRQTPRRQILLYQLLGARCLPGSTKKNLPPASLPAHIQCGIEQ